MHAMKASEGRASFISQTRHMKKV